MSKPAPKISVRHAVATWPADAPRGAVSAFCTEHGVSRAWFYKVRTAAGRVGPVKALEIKRPVPLTSPKATAPAMVELLLATRADLEAKGLDHGPLSVIAKLSRQGFAPPSRATVARIFDRAGVVVPEPRKKPRSAYQRFVYPQPNACWQIDATEWRLADGKTVAVFQLLDDHSRLALASLAATGETSEAAIAVVALAIERHGVPEKFLSDNGAVLNPTRRGRTGALVEFLKSHGVEPITGRPGKPTTQGKNERFHRTLHQYLHRQPAAPSIPVLQAQIDAFDHYYNTEREHQALPGALTPQEAWDATPKTPAPALPEPAMTVPAPAQSTQRLVRNDGRVTVLGTAFNIGQDQAGSTVHIVYDHAEIMFFDTRGTEITTHPLPVKGTRYVGNGKPSGIAADPAGARRKRTRYPRLKPPTDEVSTKS
ncbi:DDE-type integrase/transposase/recombinase [Arthrobacter sp. MMS18-M83]|uniref:DDE-type integrase/transposase/recombinase n=1 Tax=Arthrobacter sp. MMS18-M83 TaxID=2996261 RepID=UPI00227A4E21|nr:DDE-type integrase/transposase/recombinase [Arthrobacter sp. MMS18-M83]WAH98311.1 DDE-type integrase/transposase/recombinase [Arthrobacter sp. MMS18-M83]